MLIIVNMYLFWGAWQDLKKKSIRNEYLWIGGIIGLIYRGFQIATDYDFMKEWIWALVPGVFLLLIAKITKEKVGYGDGLVLMILGNFFDIMEICYLLQTAVFLVMIFFIGILCTKKCFKEYRIPFLPFLWGAYILFWGINYV